ncbi:50S ribosomal protein L16 [Candidatus Microgenomates bacterium]|jgi:large subunit ribosomal protein L16|nr:MAG: 50S ribosomal protein L16 [Candidatus Microgenomates bacterium]
MLAPKRQKYRKTFRGKNRGKAIRGSTINFGEYGLKALAQGMVSSAQIEAARKAIAHYTKREGKIWIRVFPDKPITGKPSGTRMGGGKGDIQGYVVPVTPGKVLFELAGVNGFIASEALRRAADKLPVKTKFLKRDEI